MRRGLVGHEIEAHAPAGDLGEDVGGVSEEADRHAFAVGGVALNALDRIVEAVGHLVEVTRLEAPLDVMRVDLDRQAGRARERRRKRLGAAHPAEPSGEDRSAGQVG